MARIAQPKTTKPAAAAHKPARAAPATKPAVTKAGAAKAGAVATPKLSKDELRGQVEQLTQANAKLRTKSRETNKAAKAAAQRIAGLEEQVAEFERLQAKAAKPPRKQRQPRGVDPGHAVPLGAVSLDPASMDDDADAALNNLERNLPTE